MGHRQLRVGKGQPHRTDSRNALPPLAGTALHRLHLLLRVPSQLGRIQTHGTRTLRRTEIHRPHSRTPRRPETRRITQNATRILQLLPGTDDDLVKVPPALRWTTTRPRITTHSETHGHRSQHPGRHRRLHAENGSPCPPGHRNEQTVPRRWSRTQLRGQWPNPPRRTVR